MSADLQFTAAASGQPVRARIPRMDDDGSIAEGIRGLAPVRDADESPCGRMAGIERDMWLAYLEMHQLLTGAVAAISPTARTQRLQDLMDLLVDLGGRCVRAYEELQEERRV